MKKKPLLLAALFAVSWLLYYNHASADITTAVCSPAPPNNSVVAGASSCTIVNGIPSMTVTILVPKVDANNTNAYRMVLNLTPSGVGDVVMILAGTVTAGSACDGSETITTHGLTYYRLDRTQVTFTTNNKPPVMWGLCT
jgi:hypothetical protein